MFRFLFTTGTGTGHVNPVLPVVRTLVDRGHQVIWITGRAYEAKVEATGATFRPFPERIDTSLVGMYEFFPEYAKRKGLAQTRYMLKHVFLDACPAEFEAMESVLPQFPADVLVSDVAIFAPYFASEMGGPPSALISFVPLALPSRDTAPYGLGVVPSDNWLGRVRNRFLNFLGHRILLRDVTHHANAIRSELGLAPLDKPFLRAMFELPDLVLCLTTPAFEYPRSDLPQNVHFVGPVFPRLDTGFEPPSWWDDLSGPEPVILVNQGTEATDLEDLVGPTIRGLQSEPVLVVAVPVQTGQLGDLPDNARAEPFIPFDRLLPHVNVMVSNGGYGGTQMALAHGIPLVVAGETEDKMEVAARVEWTHTGINLRKQHPSPDQIRRAVKEVLAQPRYRENARAIQADFAQYDAPARASELLESLAQSVLDR
ncbi:MAG: glycosyltransferase [Anaerolineae bacterium]|jgi:MGT family glycosyltransferase